MNRPLASVLIAATIVLAACDGGSPPAPADATPSDEPRPLPDATAVLELGGGPDATGRYRVTPISDSVEVGVKYEFLLNTRCGLDLFVDFNGSLWDAVDEAGNHKDGPPPGFETPRDSGTMTLVNQELAEFVSSAGKEVRFIRHPGAKKIKPCPG